MQDKAWGVKLNEAAPLIDAGMINLFFEDGDGDTCSGTEIMGMVELYGDIYVRKITPFAGGVEIQMDDPDGEECRGLDYGEETENR